MNCFTGSSSHHWQPGATLSSTSRHWQVELASEAVHKQSDFRLGRVGNDPESSDSLKLKLVGRGSGQQLGVDSMPVPLRLPLSILPESNLLCTIE